MKQGRTMKVCAQGHTYYKSSDCPVCPKCEAERKPAPEFMKSLSAPARRALERSGLISLEAVAAFGEERLLGLHGLGPQALFILKQRVRMAGLKFARY